MYHVQGATYDEDASCVRTGGSPRAMATLRHLAISPVQLAGFKNTAQAIDHYHYHSHPADALHLIGLTMR
jgi:hypothetical protein